MIESELIMENEKKSNFLSIVPAKCFLLLIGCTFGSAKVGWSQTDTLRLLFAGDIMGHGAQIKSAETQTGEYDYRPCFKYVKPLVEQADLAIGNLELTLPGRPPYKGYPMFRSPNQLADALKDAGFDVLVTANNHSNDSRGAGVKQTIETLRNKGFWQTGTFVNAKERSAFYPLMLYENGFKLAVLNYTYGTNGIPTEAPTIVNLLDTVQMAKDLTEARARKPHFIIVITHWGLEYQLTENAEQRALARFLIRNGADLIVGAHPHVVQPVKEERVGDKSVVVAYSLGNYISNQTQPHTDGGIMFQVELLHRKGVPRAEVGRYGYLPVYRYIHQPAGKKASYHVLPIDRMEANPDLFPDMSPAAREKMSVFGAALRKRLGSATAW
jgi:poly-gamma-glutamate capsule biosynthesis protein CapA/YwtB (metallophosphatase superfamily)